MSSGNVILDDARSYVQNMNADLRSEVDFHLETDMSPAEYAMEFARDNEIDLIVVGCKGHHSRWKRALMGTVSTKLLNEAPCQVLVVR
jgi:nucleotide-binding universal stress UspA family protein